MRRRDFIAALTGAASWLSVARAQQAIPVIGIAGVNIFTTGEGALAGMRRGLAASGFVEGKNFRFEFREVDHIDRYPTAFRELVDEKVTVIVAATAAQLEAAKAATQSIPIIFQVGVDPVENGFVASLSRPGGNLTGVFNLATTTTGKRVELLRELVPSLTKFAFLTNPSAVRLNEHETKAAKATADLLHLNLLIVNAVDVGELDAAFATSIRESAGGMVLGSNGLFFGSSARQVAALADRYRLPVISVDEGTVREGGLASYSLDYEEIWRLTGNFAGRILKGEKPANMPVQQASRTRFVINLKTAKALGIAVSRPLLGQVDEVIE